jgi:hypothetical protein
MRVSRVRRVAAPVAGAACLIGLAGFATAAVSFNGNGASGFGGTLGNGSLSLSDSAGNLTATFNPSGGFGGNDVVVYIDSIPGGFSDTSSFSDNGDGGRTAVSAANTGNPSRELITFPTGFKADYALEFENNTFIGLFGLAAGGNNSLSYVTGTGPASGGPYTVSFPLSDIGLTPGQSFSFVGDLISTTAYGSNETIGSSVTIPDTGAAPNAGFNGQVVFSSADSYTTTAVPEPGVGALFVAAGSLLMLRNRRRLQPVRL